MTMFDDRNPARDRDDDDTPNDGMQIKKERLLVDRLYCQDGHPLIVPDNPKFSGEPGIKLLAGGRNFSQILYLSPFYRDDRRVFERPFEPGEVCSLRCPVCTEELPLLAPHDCHKGAMYVTLLMNPDAPVSSSVCLCNAWGCYESFLSLYRDVVRGVNRP